MSLLTCLAIFAVWWTLLRWRLVPTRLMSLWFLLVNLLLILPSAGLTLVFAPLLYVGVPRYWRERLAILPLAIAFRVVWRLNPQIRMYVKFDKNVDGRPAGWCDLPPHNCALVGNHVSFWDVYAFLIECPFLRQFSFRTMLKASLYKVPFFGGALVRQGHFPVYFKSDEDGNFQVDKERQAAVQEKVNRHIGEGGNLAVFPEGALNKHPTTLQPFRYGTFQTIMDHCMPTYYAVLVGNEKTWPRGSLMGGRPADLCGRIGFFPIDFDREDIKEVAINMRARMQEVYIEGMADLESIKAGNIPPGYRKV